MFFKKGINFCDINPTCYKISTFKEILKRNLKDIFSLEKFAREKKQERLPASVFSFSTNMIKRAPGVDITTQLNKAVNIRLAAERINGTVIHPGEVFSFWKTVGKATKKKGYKEGRVIINNKLVTGLGGGLCNLGNSINRVILHSPLKVTEFHKHSDALAPDEGKRIPLGAGTAVSYNYIDYRFKNETDQDFQLLVWCEDEELCVELRAQSEIGYSYELVEEEHRFVKRGEKFYRLSKVYRNTYIKGGDEPIEKELIWDNRSEVMFDPSLIPSELIANV